MDRWNILGWQLPILWREAFHGPLPLWKIAYSKMDRWMTLQQGLPILYSALSLWNGQMEPPGLAASHTSKNEAFYASQVVQKKVA